jgi:hypothetical protein
MVTPKNIANTADVNGTFYDAVACNIAAHILRKKREQSTDFLATKQLVCTEGSRLWANRVLRGIFAYEREEMSGDEKTT